MRKVGFIILFSYYFTTLANVSQDTASDEHGTSPIAAVIMGAIVIVAIVVVLYRRQKRKFND